MWWRSKGAGFRKLGGRRSTKSPTSSETTTSGTSGAGTGAATGAGGGGTATATGAGPPPAVGIVKTGRPEAGIGNVILRPGGRGAGMRLVVTGIGAALVRVTGWRTPGSRKLTGCADLGMTVRTDEGAAGMGAGGATGAASWAGEPLGALSLPCSSDGLLLNQLEREKAIGLR